MENTSPGGDAVKNEIPKPVGGDAAGADVAAKAAGGIQSWLPLVVTLVAMPLLAYATTTYLLVPQLKKSIGVSSTEESHEAAEPQTHAAAKESGKSSGGGGAHGGSGSEKEGSGKVKHTATFAKVLVNVAGTMGSRYLMTTFTLVANNAEAKSKIEDNRDLLLDLSSSALGAKTLADLEKPGWRNLLRSELLTLFNDALGKGTVQEIYLTEIAVQ
ncbi:MAG TPA: flagellar basal body-associated FliL family protein [Candidatus Paceibacterota bacterium]|nr:flagellar basal body-associated FliL family protein [Candidatus Paceibacterota bacterium]